MLCIITFTLLFITSVLSAEKPSFIPRCCREDPKLSECFIKATEELRPYTKTGHRKFKIPSLSPLFIQEVNFEQETQSLDVKAHVKNAAVNGLDTYQFTTFAYNPKNYTFSGHVKIGALSFKGKVDFQGEVLQLKLSGFGDLNGISEPTEASFNVYGKVIKKDDVEYFQVVDGNANIKKLDGKVKFENFAADNNQFIDAFNDVINSNSQILIKQLRPSVEELSKTTIMEIVNSLAATLPYNEVFPHCDKQ